MNTFEKYLGAAVLAGSAMIFSSSAVSANLTEKQIDALGQQMRTNNTFWKLVQATEPSDAETEHLPSDTSDYLTLVGPCKKKDSADKAVIFALEDNSSVSVFGKLNAWLDTCAPKLQKDSDSFWAVVDAVTSGESPDLSEQKLRKWAFDNVPGAQYLIDPPK